jgi:NAD+ kinase
VLAVEVISRSDGAGVLWCDGRRMVQLPLGARIEARRGEHPVRFARLHSAPFTDRLVAKFDLPVRGWRGAFAGGDREFDEREPLDRVIPNVHGEPVRDTPSA